MSRKLTAAGVALALAGGVYLGSGTAKASNMGFKLERDFAFQDGFRNIYYVSYPLFNGLGDVAGATGGGNKCTNTPDGVIDTFDAICDIALADLTTCTRCTFTMNRLNTTTCLYEPVTASKGALGINFLGTPWVMTQDPNRDIGYLVTLSNQGGAPNPVNRAVIVGSHDPSWTGHAVSAASCLRDIIGVPYHVMYQHAAEILCGLETTDWQDADSNGCPDTCPNGIYDGTSGARVAILTFDNVPGNNEFPTNTDNQFISFAIQPFGTSLTCLGKNFSLAPGEGYLLNLLSNYNSKTFLPPHF